MATSYFNTDTIASIVTAPNAMAALGVIRVSGESAWACVSGMLRRHEDEKSFDPEHVESHRLYRCVVSASGKTLDDGMFVWMKNPRSFTGEHAIELHLHGSPLLLRRVMQELQNRGARQALPGEFSFRAFKNGKLSLQQAESVSDLIGSRSEEGARRALSHLLGRSSREIVKLQKVLIDCLAEVEIDIDFSDQGLSVIDHGKWAAELGAWVDRVQRIRQEFAQSTPLREGIRLALVGEPNSGKSSLFNRLLGEDRSIVSQEAGTTRDVIREAILLRGLLFRLSDTAGIRSTANAIESEGIDRSFGEMQSADLVLWIFDGTNTELSLLECQWAQWRGKLGESTKLVAVWNKSDQAPNITQGWLDFFRAHGIPTASLSALTGEGVDFLLSLISGIYERNNESQDDFLISRTRHYEVLGKAAAAISGALEKVEKRELFPDLLAADLRLALSLVGEITGEFSSDDLLNHIFAEFCIGK